MPRSVGQTDHALSLLATPHIHKLFTAMKEFSIEIKKYIL